MGLIRIADGKNVGVLFVLFILWNLLGFVSLAVVYPPIKGTPINMAEIIIGRCEEYQRLVHPELFQKNELKNCTDLWLKLQKAFVYKDPCNVTEDDYRDYIEAAYHKIDTQDKVLYWSGTAYPMVLTYAEVKINQYVTLRDILPAYVIINMENWCGQVTPPGINYDECPKWSSCPLLAIKSFWTALSRKFALDVNGTVHVMLNGSSDQPYRRKSVFAQSELQYLDAARTPTLHAHLAYAVNGTIKERCGNGTIVLLREDVELKGMTFKCSDDELDILYLQCATDLQANRCKAITTV